MVALHRREMLALSAAGALATPCALAADAYPANPIQLVVPFSAGGGYTPSPASSPACWARACTAPSSS